MLGLLALAVAPPAVAKARKQYWVRATLAERYFSTQADGSSWESQASIDVEFRTTYKTAFAHTPINPTKVFESHFEAALHGRGPGGATNCSYVGKPGPKGAFVTLTVPASERVVEVQWPAAPGLWTQTRTLASTSLCPPTFLLNPLEGFPPDGETRWDPEGVGKKESPTDHFNSAIMFTWEPGPKYPQFDGTWDPLRMQSLTTYQNGELYTVDGWGTIAQGDVPINGKPQSYLGAQPDEPDAPLPSLNALKKMGRREFTVPKGCLKGEKRRKKQRCP